MHLELNGQRIPVNQLGLDFAIVDAPAFQPPVMATLWVQVDEDLTGKPVFLPEGIRPGVLRTRLSPA
jgi:hypothetical protein